MRFTLAHKTRCRSISLASCILLIAALHSKPAQAQQTTAAAQDDRVGQWIQQQRQAGEISLDEAMLYRFYHLYHPRRLSEVLPSSVQPSKYPHKCPTPFWFDYSKINKKLAKSTRDTIDKMASLPSYQKTLLSPSGRFRLHYSTTGEDSVPAGDENSNGVPDFIDKAAFYADSVWRHEVWRLGFRNPVTDNMPPYEIYFTSEVGDYYGVTQSSGNAHGSYMKLHPTYENFPPNTDEEGNYLGALKVSLAHEFKHAIHFLYDEFGYNQISNWLEMDATLMEEEVFDDVNDYYNYLDWQGNSLFPTNNDGSKSILPGSYGHVTWALYFRDRFGMQYWVDVWDEIAVDENQPFTEAMRKALSERNADFNEELIRSHFWHYAAGPEPRIPGYGFEEATRYPRSELSGRFNKAKKTSESTDYLGELQSYYHEITPASGDTGSVLIGWFPNNRYAGIGLLGRTTGGEVVEWIPDIPADSSGYRLWNTNWKWEELHSLLIVTANTRQNTRTSFNYIAGNRKQIEQLAYGTLDTVRTSTPEDAATVLDHLTGIRTLPAIARMKTEVSGNGKLSVFDASLILRSHYSEDYYFPVDENRNSLGPDYQQFQKLQGSTIIPSGSRALSMVKTDTLEADPAGIRFNQHNTTAEDSVTLSITLEPKTSDTLLYSSIFLRLQADHSNWGLRSFKLNTDGWGNGLAQVSQKGDTLLLAAAAPGQATDYQLGSLNLSLEQGSEVSFSIINGQLDERYHSLTMEGDRIIVGPESLPADERPERFFLEQNYPNPFNPQTRISFALPEGQQVRLEIYDIQGRLVGRVIDRYMPAGNHQTTFRAGQLSSGVYLYRLSGTGHQRTRKMMLIK